MRRQITELCSIVKSECDFLDLGIENNKIKLDYTSSFTMLFFFLVIHNAICFVSFTVVFCARPLLWSLSNNVAKWSLMWKNCHALDPCYIFKLSNNLWRCTLFCEDTKVFLFIYLFFKALLLVSKWPKYVVFSESQSLNCPGSSKPSNVAGVEALLEEIICQKKKKIWYRSQWMNQIFQITKFLYKITMWIWAWCLSSTWAKLTRIDLVGLIFFRKIDVEFQQWIPPSWSLYNQERDSVTQHRQEISRSQVKIRGMLVLKFNLRCSCSCSCYWL